MPPEYYAQCPEVEIGTMTFKHSKLYTPVAGFAVTNEWDLLDQNDVGGLFTTNPMKYFRLISASGWDSER